ncbi:MAG TPA: YARHG domain-containing protein [Clostridiaceae bacterium]|nr:YARHG domain-containing protein [Clostridiaceae bacterium]
MFCNNCGEKLADGSRFCGECGAPVIQQEIAEATEALESSKSICRNCGTELEDDALFCSECGTPVNKPDHKSEISATQTMKIPPTQPVHIMQPVHTTQPLHKGYLQHAGQETGKKKQREKREKENLAPLIITLIVVIIVCAGVIWYTLNRALEPVDIEIPDISTIEQDAEEETAEEGTDSEGNEESESESEEAENTDTTAPASVTVEERVEEQVEEHVEEEVTVTMETQPEESDFLFPSDREYITEEFLDTLSKEEIALIRNEIYARHGYIFQTEPYKSYFSGKSWYVPNENFDESMLSEIERENVNTILEYEERMGWC